MPRVGRLLRLGRSVYARADGTFWYRSGSRRKPVHGLQLWETIGGLRMRGSRPFHVAVEEQEMSLSESDTDDEMQAALAASLQEDELQAALLASLQDAPSEHGEDRPSEVASCAVCMEDVEHGARALRCGHVFHARCVAMWLRRSSTCPVCRARA